MTPENKTIIENVMLNTVSEVQTFVALTSTISNEINVCSDRYIINGKSILGLYSLDLTRPLRVEIDSEVSEDFISQIREFVR